MEVPQPTAQPRRRRPVWPAILVGAVGQIVLICLFATLVSQFASTHVRSYVHNFAAKTSAHVCPQAKPTDAVPHDSTGQFTIQPVYAEVLTYARDAAGQPASQRVHLWDVDVLGQYPPMDDIFTNAVGGVDVWNTALRASSPAEFRCVVADMQTSAVEARALTVLQLAAKELAGPTTTAYLVPWYTTRFYGASGEKSLLIPFWEQAPLDRTLERNAATDWFYMPEALNHEYFEVVRYDRLGSLDNAYQNLLGNIVTDGLADNFAAHMTNAPLRDRGISPDEEATLWQRFQPDLTSDTNQNEASEMLGDPTQNIPNGAGYAIGDHIVSLYLRKHPDVTFSQLAGMDAQTIFDGSGYNG
ncbi:MAG TPA: DUF2268 domain-containing putative Zn-dependent protease [Ktedonobacterales bacterium]